MIDLSDHDSYADGFPHEVFRWLREHDPVHWHAPTDKTPDGDGFWVVSRYDGVMEVFRNAQVFSSDKGGERTAGGTTLKDERVAGKQLNFTDAPYHRTLRSLVNKGFTTRSMAKLEDQLTDLTHGLIDAWPDGEAFDFVHAFARELPLQAICLILGVPHQDRKELCDWVETGLEIKSDTILSGEYAIKIKEYARDLIAEKRRRPTDDILSTIVHAKLAEEDDRQLTGSELRSFFLVLFLAGSETTRSTFGIGLKALLEYPDQVQALRRDSGLMKSAAEEMVRWSSPSIYKRRTVTRDVEFGGRAFKAGDKVTVWEPSANRDEDVFTDPFRFDIARTPNKHVGFGFGAHVCLGAALARMELQIGFSTLLARTSEIEMTDRADWVANNRLLGLRSLPVRIKFGGSRHG